MITTFVEKHPNALFRAILFGHFTLTCSMCVTSITAPSLLHSIGLYCLLILGGLFTSTIVAFWITIGIIRLVRAHVDGYLEVSLPFGEFHRSDSERNEKGESNGM